VPVKAKGPGIMDHPVVFFVRSRIFENKNDIMIVAF